MNCSYDKSYRLTRATRIAKTNMTATTYFLYSAKGLIAEYDTGGSLVQGYLFGANTYSTNPVLTYKPNTNSSLDYHFYHNDHLFTPQRLTDSSGALSWSADYSAFGETTITIETTTNNLRFPGQYYDADINLSQNYFRDYSAELGRYVESDPIGLDGGINFYGYAYLDPLRFTDPTGKIVPLLLVSGLACVVNVITSNCLEDKVCNCIIGGVIAGAGFVFAAGSAATGSLFVNIEVSALDFWISVAADFIGNTISVWGHYDNY